jgi:hypothetical protein
MPMLAWVAFWSWFMGHAACWDESPQLVRVKRPARRNHPAV